MRINIPARRGLSVAVLTAAALVAGSTVAVPTAGGAENSYSLDRTLYDSRIRESSGLARSNDARRVLFTHNDSGDGPRVYAVSKRGRTRAVLTLDGANARDWEDISEGPRRSMWVGDIGDNRRVRSTITVYRFREPKALSSRSVPSTAFHFRYADGRHNAEGLMVHPRSGRLYVVTKATSGAGIYVAPQDLSTSKVNVLRRVASAPELVKAASFSRDGSRFVLSGGTHNYIYRSIGGRPVVVRKPPLRQGESVEITRNGKAMLVGSEGSQSPVYRMPMP